MSTMSFSVEDDIKRDFAVWAKRAKKSKSDLFRDMVSVYRFNAQLSITTKRTESVLENLGITTEDELYDYLESGKTYHETYEDRLRQQRLSGGN